MNEKSNVLLSIFLVILCSILCLFLFAYRQTKNTISEEVEVIALHREGIFPREKEETVKKANDEVSESMLATDNPMPWYIRVNLEAQVVNVYTKDNEGRYTVPYKAMLCSTGIDTPREGVYVLPESHENPVKARWRYLQGDVWGQYVTRIVDSILFHSVPYEDKSESTLEWWEYDRLGEEASLGCIRLCVADAKWIYDNCQAGTQVEFYTSSNPRTIWKTSIEKNRRRKTSISYLGPN